MSDPARKPPIPPSSVSTSSTERVAQGALGQRLHVGCGPARLEGWVNIDRQELPGVDLVADVTEGLPFTDAEVVYAEHFLEHLPLDHALAFLREAHRVLAPGGWLRLSTPNLDWVLEVGAGRQAGEPQRHALHLNRSFHGWSHRFLWNQALLGEALAACGFEQVRWCRHGESAEPLLRGLERHETYVDTPELPHVLIAEARRGAPQPERYATLRQRLDEEFLAFVRPLGHQVEWRESTLVAHLPLAGPLGRWLGAHVARGWLVGGSLRLLPEAPEASELRVDVDLRHLLLDEPGERRAAGLRAMPEALRRRAVARLLGAQGLDVEGHPLVTFRAQGEQRIGEGRTRRRGVLELRGARRELTLDLVETREGEVWRAAVDLALDPGDFGLPPWRPLRGLLRAGGRLRVELRLVARPVYPT